MLESHRNRMFNKVHRLTPQASLKIQERIGKIEIWPSWTRQHLESDNRLEFNSENWLLITNDKLQQDYQESSSRYIRSHCMIDCPQAVWMRNRNTDYMNIGSYIGVIVIWNAWTTLRCWASWDFSENNVTSSYCLLYFWEYHWE